VIVIRQLIMQNLKRLLIQLFTVSLVIASNLSAMEKESSPTETQNEKESLLPFSVANKALEQHASSDEIHWVDVNSQKHLLLIHNAKGRKERGHVLLLHAQGENADHSRLIQPLAKQLTRLGWKVFSPNIAVEDYFVEEKKPENISTQNNNSENKQNNNKKEELAENPRDNSSLFYFESIEKYQEYYINLCKAIFEQSEITKRPLMIIANQHSAYWSIPCLNLANGITPIIFLQPELPLGVTNNLDELFSQQTSPLFSFRISNTKKDPFTKSFAKRLWRAKSQRFNVGMLQTQTLDRENTSIARTITGWIEKQRKKNR